jgi:hypothetical protein
MQILLLIAGFARHVDQKIGLRAEDEELTILTSCMV